MKNRGRSPAGAKASALRSGTGSSGHSLASDHGNDEQSAISTYPSGTGALAAVTSTLAAATAEETSLASLTLPANMSASSNVSPSHHVRHHSSTLPFTGSHDHDSFSLGNSIFYDDPEVIAKLSESGTPDPALTQKAIEHYQSKIGKTKELIKEVQTSLDENVNEYLKLSANATDGVQQQRIKQVFEKKNQKSAQQIAQLQRKLDEYNRKVRDLEKHGLQKPKIRDIGQNLKHVGGTIRDGISGMSSTVMSRPKEFANFVLRGAGGNHKFGSADNLSASLTPSNPENTGSKVESASRINNSSEKTVKPNSLPREGSAGGTSSLLSNENRQSSFEERRKCLSEDGGLRHRSSRPSDASTASSIPPAGGTKSQSSHGQHIAQQQNLPTSSPNRRPNNFGEDAGGGSDGEWNAIIQELTLHKEEVDRLREEMEDLRQQCKADVETLTYKLYEERESYARLEEQINDLTELHQHEIENIKSGITDMEEKVQYQSEERLLDIKEHLQGLETKVTSMEHQQVQQQYLNIEGLDGSDARAIMMKLINAIITFVHVILFLIGTFMNLAKPFLRTTSRLLITTVIVIVSVCAYHQQEVLVALFLKLKNKSSGGGGGSSGSGSSAAASGAKNS